MLVSDVRPCPLRILAAPGQWPLLPQKAIHALESAPLVLWQRGADPSLLAMLGPDQRLCELSHSLEVPSALRAQELPAKDLVLLQAPSAPSPDWLQSLGSSFSRFETLRLPSTAPSLAPTRVILTRSHAHNLDLGKALLNSGLSSLSLPTLAFGPAPDPKKLTSTLACLSDFFGVIVSSPRGAKVLATAPDLPVKVKVVAVGASTAKALERHQLPCHLVPELPHSEGLVKALKQAQWLNQRWLHLRGNLGRDVLETAITAAKGEYTLVPCYQSLLPSLASALLNASLDPHLKMICFASGQSYLNYKRLLSRICKPDEIRAHLKRLQILSFGPITSDAIRQDGQTPLLELSQPSAQQQLTAIQDALLPA